MGSKFIVPLRLLEMEATPAVPLANWHKLYYKSGYLKTLKDSEKDVVLDRPLDGFVAGPCTPVVATDTVLEAFQKLQCQITALSLLDTFLELTDTPSSYLTSGGYLVAVNGAEDALEFIPFPTIPNTFLELTDTPTDYAGSAGYALVVNGTEDAVEFAPFPTPLVEIVAAGLNIEVDVNAVGNTTTYTVSTKKDLEICNLTMTPIEVTLGSLETYTLLGDTSTVQPDFGDIQLSPPVVIVPGVVELSRDAGGGQIYNAVNESTAGGFYDNDWPSDTEWNSVFTDPVNYGFADLTNVKDRIYNNFVNANNGFGTFPGPTGVGNNVVGLELVCHVISTDQYFKFTFTSWDKGSNPPGGPWGGFVVDVQEITVSDPCEITFSDGTTQTTAPVPTQICGFPLSDPLPTDTVTLCRDNGEGGYDNFSAILPNTWDIRNVAFLSTFGNDSTAVVGDGNKPFRTFAAAQAAADIIFVKDGSWGTETIVSNKTIYFYPGTQMYRLRDGGATVTNTEILGKLKFRSFGYGVELTGSNSDVYVECDEFDNVRVICFAYNGSSLHVKCRRAFCNGSWGGGFATSARDGGSIVLEVTERCTTQYWLNQNRGANTSFTVKCPNIVQQPGGIFGSTPFGSLISYQGSVTQGGNYLVDLMGGTLTRTRGQGSSFGVRDSALLLAVNCFGGNPTPIFKFQNGVVDANTTLGILIEYIVLRIHCELNNIKLKTTSKPIEMSQRAVNLAGWTEFCNFIARNCSFEGDLDNELGNCRIARFFNCNFKTLGGTSNFIFNNANGASPGEAYFVNCNAELTTGPGEMLTGFTGKTIGLLNTYSNEPIGAGAVDTWGGHSTIPTLTLPNLEL